MQNIVNNGNKTQLMQLMQKSFNNVVSSYNKGENEDLLDWLVLKINIALKKPFNGDLYIEKYVKLEGQLTTRTYDLVIKSARYNKVLLVISINKLNNNITQNFFTSYKETIFNTMNLGINKIPYYTLTISPLKSINSKGQMELFSAKNLLRLYNGNNSNIIPGINKIMLIDGDIKGENFNILQSLDTLLRKDIAKNVENAILMKDIKMLFIDIYNILKKYV